MSSSKQVLPGLLLTGLFAACGPMTVEPELTLSASPRTIDGLAQKATIKVVAVDDKAKPGTGKVRLTSTAGSLTEGVEVDLLAGEGTTELTCARATDPLCTGTVRVTAEWVVSGKLVSASTSVTVTPAALPPPDAGTSLAINPARLVVGARTTSSIVATYTLDGVPTPDASVSITTSLGLLLAEDGGAFAAVPTDSAGQVRARLSDNGSAGVATITAAGPRGPPATASVTFEAVDAGPMLDGGYSVGLAADKSQIIAGVGDQSILTATVVSLGNVADLPISFVTTIGRLGPVSGSAVGTTFLSTTDDAGVARAQLSAGSMEMGQASVTARIDGGVSNTVNLTVVNVSQIAYVSTECPQTVMNCNLMGLQGSGFNETALVKFKVTDGTGIGVSGVRVDFSLVGAPAGTSVDPTSTTNSMGEVRANVRSGTTIGSFSVTATALSMFSVTSPTIGVRGAKASNRGFSLRCDRVNLAAYAAVTPPLPLTIGCQVGLSDRYGNPIGTGTQVRLNSEAGIVPNNVATTPFTPTATNEGFGSFTFNTSTNTLPLDVAPFAAAPGQYPIPLAAEPSVPGTVVRNPRDGLVTLIAYLQGEEDFKDDNSNGVRDSNEQFVDQAEPFVDSNDNNQWDTGETFVDTPPSDGGVPNGQWDGPNGVWDSNAQIWTEYRLLYTGVASPSNSMLTLANSRTAGGSYGTLALNSSLLMNVFAPDQHLNRVEGGAMVTARFAPSTRGQISIVNNTAGLDGYGFELQRLLVNAAGTGACTTTELACRWKVVMGSWSEGLIAGVQLNGALPPSMPVSQTAIVEVGVRGVTVGIGAGGTVE